jgi:hypothetical protein
MKKDIHPPKVENVAVAIVKERNEINVEVWNVYLLNLGQELIEGVLVTSKGYGEVRGESVKTSVLRHFLDTIEPGDFAKIEPIMENLFGISNEYWVSFYKHRVMYDKKYVFVAESISENHLTNIPIINQPGVMIL